MVQPPSPDSQNSKPEKKATVAGGAKKKGRIVTSTAAKKRPVITRRQSSQSSTDSTVRVEAQNVNQSSTERTPPTISETSHGKGKAPSRLQENFSPERLAAPSRRKLPSSKSADPKRTSRRKPDPKDSGMERSPEMIAQGEPGPSSGLHSVENRKLPNEETSEGELDLQRTILKEANARVKKSSTSSSQPVFNKNESFRGQQTSLATISDGTNDTDMSGIRLKSAASLAPKLADATAQIGLSDSTTLPPQGTGSQGRIKGDGRDPEDMFAKRPVPSALGNTASPSPDGPLSKSKSQLTLLLQKDRARTGEQEPTDGRNKDRQK